MRANQQTDIVYWIADGAPPDEVLRVGAFRSVDDLNAWASEAGWGHCAVGWTEIPEGRANLLLVAFQKASSDAQMRTDWLGG